MVKIKSVYLLFIFLFTLGCQSKDFDKKAMRLKSVALEINEINCKSLQLRDSIQNEWNRFNEMLETRVPADMPEREKQNLLKLSNAPLIRIFKWYNRLDDTIKVELRKVEILDSLTVDHVSQLSKSIQKLEDEKIQLMIQLNQWDESRFEEIKEEIIEISERPCLK